MTLVALLMVSPWAIWKIQTAVGPPARVTLVGINRPLPHL
jgi:hypothetical protein